MRPHAEARTKALQAAGIDAQLTIKRWGSESQYLLITQRYATLADLEKAQAAVTAVTQQFTPLFAPLAGQNPVTALSEILQVANPSQAKWQQANVLVPAIGKGPELRALLVERVKVDEVQGRHSSLLVQVAGPDSGSFSRVFRYSSLAELEENRARVAASATDAGTADFNLKRDALLGRPISSTIREVLIPFAS